jgi:hypothetical protein
MNQETVIIECFPLPSVGKDPFFGFSRSFWLKCEREKLIKLRRMKLPGRIRAQAICIPYAEAKTMLDKAGFIPGGHREL